MVIQNKPTAVCFDIRMYNKKTYSDTLKLRLVNAFYGGKNLAMLCAGATACENKQMSHSSGQF